MIFWKKGSNLCVIQEIKRFNSQKNSILWVGFKKIQFCEFFLDEKTLSPEKKGSISLNQNFSNKFKYLSHVKKKVQFFESCEKGPSIWIMKKRRNNSLSQIEPKKKKFNSLSHIFNKKKDNPLTDIQEGFNSFNILSVFFKKKTQFLKITSKKFNSVSQF